MSGDALLSGREDLVFRARMEGDKDDLGARRPRSLGVGEDLGRVDDIDGPLLVGRKLETVEPVGVGEQRHLDAVRVEHRRAGLLLGAAVAASVLETGGVHGVEGPLDAVDALVDGVVRRGRASIEAGVDEGGEDLLRHREDRIARVGTAGRCDRRLQVADG